MSCLLDDILRAVEFLAASRHGFRIAFQKILRQTEVLHESAYAEAELHKIPPNTTLQEAAIGELRPIIVDEMDVFAIPK